MERYRTTLILVGVLVVLAAAAIFLNNSNSPSSATATPTPETYVWKSTDSVSGVDVVSGTDKVSLVKDASSGTWSLTAPVSKPADVFVVGGEADSLQNLKANFSVTDTTDLDQFGLGQSAMSVTVTFSNTEKTKRSFSVGNSIMGGSGYYVKASDSSSVFVVPNTTIEQLRTWLTSPPIATPSPTPLAITQISLSPTPTETFAPTPTDTPAPAQSPTPAPVGPPGPAEGATATP